MFIEQPSSPSSSSVRVRFNCTVINVRKGLSLLHFTDRSKSRRKEEKIGEREGERERERERGREGERETVVIIIIR